ncbi:tail fiber protein [Syntrophomonas curvata]
MDPLLGDIELLPYGYAPSYWMVCNGATLSISGNQALFSLIGTTFGGNGTTTFQLPNIPEDKCPAGMRYYIAVQGIYPSRN